MSSTHLDHILHKLDTIAEVIAQNNAYHMQELTHWQHRHYLLKQALENMRSALYDAQNNHDREQK